MATFSVVAMMKEEPSVLVRFVAYYRRLGAERVVIYHDGPLDDLAAAGLGPGRLDGAEVTGCDDAFWAARPGGRPAKIEDRQRAVFALAHARLFEDWVLVCDADEFVIDRIPVAEFLDAVPPEVDSAIVLSVEAVWGPGEDIHEPFGSTWFRRPDRRGGRRGAAWRRALALRLYGPLGLLFRGGVLSHVQGKQFLRRGARVDNIDIHNATRDGRSVSVPAARISSRLGVVVELAHFDAISYGRWHRKVLPAAGEADPRALDERSPQKRWQIRLFRWALRSGPAATEALCRRLYALDVRQLRLLEARGLAFQARIF